MSLLKAFFFLLLITACSKEKDLKGYWDVSLVIQDKTIPFQLNFLENKKVEFINSAESVVFDYERAGDKLIIELFNYDAQLILELNPDNKKLQGRWTRPNMDRPYGAPVTAVYSSPQERSLAPKLELAGKWKVEFFDDTGITSQGILVFRTEGENFYASVATPTGDYRYLTPMLKNDLLVLTGFDGIFAYYIEGILKDDTYSGTLYYGPYRQEKFKAKVAPNFELPDPTKTTQFSAQDFKDLTLPQLTGEKSSVLKALAGKKAKVIQIFGSWCPNCIDETKFINEWREQNPDRDVAFAMISFERSPNRAHAIKQLKKAQKMYDIDYPIFIGGHTPNEGINDVFKNVKNFISFPTTIYLDKDNNVYKVHAGFSGPATGKYYEEFKSSFNETIETLEKQ